MEPTDRWAKLRSRRGVPEMGARVVPATSTVKPLVRGFSWEIDDDIDKARCRYQQADLD